MPILTSHRIAAANCIITKNCGKARKINDIRYLRKIQFIISAMACGATLFLSACGLGTPRCADAETIKLVGKIYRESFQDALREMLQEDPFLFRPPAGIEVWKKVFEETRVGVSTIRTVDHNWQTGKYQCAAVLEITPPAEWQKVLMYQKSFKGSIVQQILPGAFNLAGSAQERDGVIMGDISYSSETTDNRQEHLVELKGHRPVAEYVIALASTGSTLYSMGLQLSGKKP